MKDRVAQMAMKLVIEPIFEAGFKASSFGFRPRRSAVQALETIREKVNTGCNHVLDADIRDYFGSIDRVLLMQRVERRITDRRVLKLLRKWLEAGVMDEGRLAETVSGTPQGGVISPLLLETKGIRRYYLQRWPSAKSMKRVRGKIHDLTDRSRNGVKDVRVLIDDLNLVLRGWGNYFCNGNAARKFNQLDGYVYRQLHRFMVRRHGRNLRAGRAVAWTPQWLWDLGLHRLRGTIRYPKQCMLHEKTTVKPCAGNPHARFERRRVETGR